MREFSVHDSLIEVRPFVQHPHRAVNGICFILANRVNRQFELLAHSRSDRLNYPKSASRLGILKPLCQSHVNVTLPHILAPAFQRLLNERHELVGDGAVDQAVGIAEGEVHDRADGDGV